MPEAVIDILFRLFACLAAVAIVTQLILIGCWLRRQPKRRPLEFYMYRWWSDDNPSDEEPKPK